MAARRDFGGLAAPYVSAAVFLVALPLGMTGWLALHRYDGLGAAEFVGTANFRAAWADPMFRLSLDNTLLFAALSVPLRMGIALTLALLLARPGPLGALWRTLVYLPSVLPEIAYALVWLWLLNPLQGPLTWLAPLGVDAGAWLTDPWSARAALIAMSALLVGEVFLVLLAVRRELPEELYEVWALEGGSAVQAFRRITLPLMLPAILLLTARDVALTLQLSFVPALVVTHGGPNFATTFLPLYVYQSGWEYLRFGYAAAMTLGIVALTAAAIAVQLWVVRLARRLA